MMNKKKLAAIQRFATDDEVEALTVFGESIMQLDAAKLRKIIAYLMKREEAREKDRATLKSLKEF